MLVETHDGRAKKLFEGKLDDGLPVVRSTTLCASTRCDERSSGSAN